MSIALVLPEHGIRAMAVSLVWDEQIGLGYRADVEAILHGAPSPDQVLGLPASIVMQSPGGERTIAGIVTRVEHRPASGEDDVVAVSIEPVLAPLAHRSDIRIFEHRTTLEIATEVLADWSLAPDLRCDVSAHPKHEYRVQYEESHLDFLRRILEEEGISLFLEPSPDGPERIVLDDAPWMREPSLELIPTDRLADAKRAAYTRLASRHELAPSALTLRDHDFALRAGTELVAQANVNPIHPALATYGMELGAFFIDGAKPEAGARSDEQRGHHVAERRLAAMRARASMIEFRTNAVGLYAGAVVRLRDLPDPVLVTALHLERGDDGRLELRVEAVDTRVHFRPPRTVPRPVVRGVQTARVTGAADEEIHVDPHGRVRVEFIWDRRARSERSSCWVRVSQGWAGSGLGLVTIPRVGQDVLVGFLDGDPDRPVIVGRLFAGSSPHPYPLPQNATKTGVRTSTVPGGEGYSELSFEDARGRELVYLRAERDRDTLVRANDRLRIEGSRDKAVRADETIDVGGSRGARVGHVDAIEVGDRFTAVMTGGSTYIDMTQGKIRMTTGAASLELDGADARLVAEGTVDVTANAIAVRGKTTIRIEAGAEVHVETADGDVVIQGGPLVRINPADADPLEEGPDVDRVPVEVPADVDLVDNIDDAIDAASFDPDHPEGVGEKLSPGGAWDFLGRGESWRAFHFFHAGVVSTAAGQPIGVVLRQEGRRYEERFGRDPERGDPGNGLWGGAAPYGLEARDVEGLQQGAAWFASTYGRV